MDMCKNRDHRRETKRKDDERETWSNSYTRVCVFVCMQVE